VEFEFAQLSLPGHRSENQDRVTIIPRKASALIAVVDGMGGHANGARASEITVDCLTQCFADAGDPVLDPQGFLVAALELAHEKVVELGSELPLEHRPRATCAICFVQDDNAYCAHVGDSRIYHFRDSALLHRSRDHSHVELLLREGVIEEADVKNHPMRNFVECCLGGDYPIPDMSIAGRCRMAPGDVLMVCSDGLWSGVEDVHLVELTNASATLESTLKILAEAAIKNNAPHSDNTSAAALRLGGTAP
jgi:serine/threonine protein phosphatase PrpC